VALPLNVVGGIVLAVQVFVSGLAANVHYDWRRTAFEDGVSGFVHKRLALDERLARGCHQRPDLEADFEGLDGVSLCLKTTREKLRVTEGGKVEDIPT
jgi:hypothetical protein